MTRHPRGELEVGGAGVPQQAREPRLILELDQMHAAHAVLVARGRSVLRYAVVSAWIPIGRFAQLAGFTVRALRHYESQGLLLPARVDRESGYRYYRPEQLHDALRVRLLRALEMPLPEVVDVMRDPESAASIEALKAHRVRVAQRLADVAKLLARLDEWLDGAPQELDDAVAALDEESAVVGSGASSGERAHRARVPRALRSRRGDLISRVRAT